MNWPTILALNAINRDFYVSRAEEFSATRSGPWRGWLRLLDRLRASAPPISVLDVGCGNGRFALFLRDHLEKPFHYEGIEYSPAALERARANLSGVPNVTLHEQDLVARVAEPTFLPGLRTDYSLIALFGVLHHVPGYETRQALVKRLAEHLGETGTIVFSVWQFGRFERFRKKIVAWDDFHTGTGVRIDANELERGDHLLSWGDRAPAYRFCHFTDSEETSRLVSSLPLNLVEVFSADGHTNDLNQYFVLTRKDNRTAPRTGS